MELKGLFIKFLALVVPFGILVGTIFAVALRPFEQPPSSLLTGVNTTIPPGTTSKKNPTSIETSMATQGTSFSDGFESQISTTTPKPTTRKINDDFSSSWLPIDSYSDLSVTDNHLIDRLLSDLNPIPVSPDSVYPSKLILEKTVKDRSLVTEIFRGSKSSRTASRNGPKREANANIVKLFTSLLQISQSVNGCNNIHLTNFQSSKEEFDDLINRKQTNNLSTQSKISIIRWDVFDLDKKEKILELVERLLFTLNRWIALCVEKHHSNPDGYNAEPYFGFMINGTLFNALPTSKSESREVEPSVKAKSGREKRKAVKMSNGDERHVPRNN